MTGSQRLTITILSADTGKELLTLRLKDGRTETSIDPFRGGLGRMTFSPDGSLLAASEKGVVHIWNVKTGSYNNRLTGFTDWIYSNLAFRADSRVLAAEGVDSAETPDGKRVSAI